jgi:hypothetical protein
MDTEAVQSALGVHMTPFEDALRQIFHVAAAEEGAEEGQQL